MTLPTLSLSGLEFRRFTRAKLTRIAIIGLTMVPLLYAGLYLWSFWDPTKHMDRVPVALVVEDHPAEAGDKAVSAGYDLAKELKDRANFKWELTTAQGAAEGVASGKYYMSLTIPPDFSQNIASPSGVGPVKPAVLKVHLNDANSYVMGSVAELAFNEIGKAAGASASKGYFDSVFVSFGTLHDKMKEAANGANQLHNGGVQLTDGAGQLHNGLGTAVNGTQKLRAGAVELSQGADKIHVGLGTAASGSAQLAAGLGTAKKGSGQLATGLGSAKQGSGQLADGLGTATSGSSQLSSGIGTIAEGNAKLADGTKQVSDGVHLLNTKIHSVADVAVPLVKAHVRDIQVVADVIGKSADAVAKSADHFPELTALTLKKAKDARTELEAVLARYPEIPAGVKARLIAAADDVVKSATALDDYTQDHLDDLKTISAKAKAIRDQAFKLEKDAPHLVDQINGRLGDLDKLDQGAAQVADGAAKLKPGSQKAHEASVKLTEGLSKLTKGATALDQGLGKLYPGARQLDQGLGKLYPGAVALNQGLGKLYPGAGQLANGIDTASSAAGLLAQGLVKLNTGAGTLENGLVTLTDGAQTLAGGLDSGYQQIPKYGSHERGERTAMMSDPVHVSKHHDNKAPNYGTGFASFFVPLSLWVGAMILFMLLKPLNNRALAGNAPPWRVALAGWIPAVIMGAAQAAIVLLVLKWRLGFDPKHMLALWLFLALAAAAFNAIVQWAYAQFGAIGKLITLVLLMLQLTSGAGTYPIETSPRFFQAIQNYLPMPWAIRGMRHLVGGGDMTSVWQACGVFVLIIAGFLTLTTLAARSGRTWSVKKLHPALTL